MQTIYLLFIFVAISASLYSQNVYFPPEYEKQEGLLLTWDYNDSRNPVTAAIAKAVQPSAKVWLIYYPGPAPTDTTEIRNYLRDHGVPDENVFLIPAWTETLWIRDYGPFNGYNLDGTHSERLFLDAGYSNYNRPNDDAIPTQIANLMGIQVNDFPLQFEGGNVLIDGLGRGWGSTRIFSQNPDLSQDEVKQTMEEYLGLDEMMFLEALVNSGGGIWCHVDMFMKILNSETILISEYPDFVPDYNLIESFADTLSKMTNANGREYQIVRIPAPPKANGTWASTQNDEMRTYTNSIIINDVIVIPSYNLPEYDSAAKQVYKESMPGYRLEMVDASPLTPLYGALHCVVKEVTKPDYLWINHEKIVGLSQYSEPFLINAEIYSDSGPDSAFVFYKTSSEMDFNKVEMTGNLNAFTASISGFPISDSIQYYIKAYLNDDFVTFPPQGEGGAFTFWFDPSVSTSEDDAQPYNIEVFPNPCNGSFTISIDKLNESVAFTIQQIDGRVVHHGIVNSRFQQMNFSDHFAKGIYLLNFRLKNAAPVIRKLIVQ